jgi:hypothetical protein
MTLAEVTLPVSLEWSRGHCLLFSPQLAERLAELHSAHGSSSLILIPVALTDGRLMLSADVLTEVEPGGLLHAMWAAADQEVLLPAVEVVPLVDALALLPTESPSTPSVEHE